MDTRRYANLGAKPVKYLKVSCTYNVKSTTSATRICYSASNLLSMKVDGVAKNTALTYTFDSLGEHFVEFNLNGTAVPDRAFSGCTDMQYVEFEDGITAIGNSAFTGCYGLQDSVVIPDSVTRIGNFAFNSCYGVTSLTLGNNLVTIGDYAFNGCNKISGELVIPDSVTSIGTGAFQTLYRMTELVLSQNLNTIGVSAFTACYNLQNVVIPDSITSMSNYMFQNCLSLKTLIIGENVTNIGDYAFQGCNKIDGELVIPDSVTSIGNGAFSGCTSITNITIPDSVISIGSNAFNSCYGVTSLTLGNNLVTIGDYVFSGCNKISGELVIPDSVTSIGNGAFSGCTNLMSITIGENVTNIGDYAFSSCSSLMLVTIGENVTSIGKQAFRNCSKLGEKFVIPDSITSIGDYAFSGCTGITTFELGKNVKSLGGEMFGYGSKVSKIICHAPVAPSVTYSTFINIPYGGTLIYPDGADYSSWLQTDSYYLGYYGWTDDFFIKLKMNIPGFNIVLPALSNLKKIVINNDVIIPNNQTYTFETPGEYNVTLYSTSSSVPKIDTEWMKYATEMHFAGKITSIGDFLNGSNSSVKKVIIGEHVSSITSTRGLYYLMDVENFIVDSKNPYFDSRDNCGHIIQTSTNKIIRGGNKGFIPNTVRSIGDSAFQYQPIGTLELPSSVTSIGSNAFASCKFLNHIVCHATVPPSIQSNTFSGVTNYGTLIYPEGADYSSWLQTGSYYLGYYKWNDESYKNNARFKATYYIDDISKPIELYQWEYSVSLLLIDNKRVPKYTTYQFDSIGYHTVELVSTGTTFSFSSIRFLNTDKIHEIEFNNTTNIDSGFCQNWKFLQKVTFNNCNCNLTNNTFKGCSSLSGELVIPDSIKQVYQYTFAGCSGLTSVKVGSGVTSISGYVFSDCPNIESIEFFSPNKFSVGGYGFITSNKLDSIIFHSTIAPDAPSISEMGSYTKHTTVYHPLGSDYRQWRKPTYGAVAGGYAERSVLPIVDNVPELVLGDYDVAVLIESYPNTVIKLCNNTDNISKINVDGVDLDSVTTGYTFASSDNLHIVKYKLIDDTVITDNCFSYCSEFYKLKLSDKIRSIGKWAFQDCSNLCGDLTLSDNITTIGYYAFEKCCSLQSVTIGNNITSINSYAFQNCLSLKTLIIGENVTSIGDYAFTNTKSLCNIIVSPNNTIYDSRENCNCLIETNTNTLILGSANSIIPQTVEIIGADAFLLKSTINRIDIPPHVKSIGSNAFAYCKSLKELYIPDSDTNLKFGASAFANSSLETVYIGSKTTDIPAQCFAYCPIKTLTLPDTLQSISNGAFSRTQIEILNIPDSVTSIGNNAFEGDSSYTALKEVHIGSSVTSIGDYAFEYHKNLKKIVCKANVAPSLNKSAFYGIANNGTLIYPEGADYSSWLSTDAYYLGYYGWNVTKTYLLHTTFNITDISEPTPLYSSYYSGTNLKGIIIDGETIEDPSRMYQFTTTGEHDVVFEFYHTQAGKYVPKRMFYEIKSISSVDLSNITSIYPWAFGECGLRGHLTIPDSVTTFVTDYENWFAYFRGCRNITGITIGSGFTELPYQMFMSCDNVKYIDLTKSKLVTIQSSALYGTRPTTITLPASLKTLDSLGTTSLNEIICLGDTPPTITNSTFSGVTKYGTLRYPEGADYSSWLSTDAYYLGYYGWYDNGIDLSNRLKLTVTYNVTTTDKPTDTGWRPIGNGDFCEFMLVDGEKYPPSTGFTFDTQGIHDIIFVWLATPTYIYNDMFSSNPSIIRAEFDDGITTIGYRWFNNCPNLVSVKLPETLTSLNSGFNGNKQLQHLKLPNSLTTLGASAFTNTYLYSIILGDNLTAIGNYAFANARNLTSITIPKSVTSIGNYAFMNCGLTGLVLTDTLVTIGDYAFSGCNKISGELVIPDSVTSIGNGAFSGCTGLDNIKIMGNTTINQNAFQNCYKIKTLELNNTNSIGASGMTNCYMLDNIICTSLKAPTIVNTTFQNVLFYGNFYYPTPDYISWLNTNQYYLGYYKWNAYQTYEPRVYYDLTINAEDVSGRATNTTITWSYMTDGVNPLTNEPITGVQYTGTTISESFGQNTSETETVERTITFEIMGMTATTTITQGVWVNQNYTVNLNSQWQLSSSISNPDSLTYDGVYESFSNKGKDSTAAIMYIDIVGYENFKLYIRSYAEGSYDYVMVSQLDQTIDNNSSYSNTTLVKAHTRSSQQSGTAIGNYKLVEFTGIDSGEHRITVVYRKDGSAASGTDQGYVLIPKNQ